MAQSLFSSFESLTDISPHSILRLIVLTGGYILLRPLIELCFRRLFATQSETQPQPAHPQKPKSLGKCLADENITGDYAPTDNEDSKDNADIHVEPAPEVGWSWGDTTRRKQQAQRQKFMEYWEAEQARRAEEEDLADIEDLLED